MPKVFDWNGYRIHFFVEQRRFEIEEFWNAFFA